MNINLLEDVIEQFKEYRKELEENFSMDIHLLEDEVDIVIEALEAYKG